MEYGTVQIGRIQDEEMKSVPFDNGHTVGDILEKSGLPGLESNESVRLDNGTVVDEDTRVTDGARYFIVTNMKAGC